ncbi:MAG: gliding motility lipoprotein GldH [Prevotella sp.]|jgi:gliding motility-associated lipoprotein GldH
MRKLMAVGLLLTILTFFGCEKGMVFDRYGHVSERGWSKQDAVEFNVPRLRQGGNYELTLGLRSTDDYPFKNISLIIQRQVFPSKRILCDTLQCSLTDNNGARRGSGFINYQTSFPVTTDTYKAGDSLHIVVRHNMRQEQIEGITDVGVSLRLSE